MNTVINPEDTLNGTTPAVVDNLANGMAVGIFLCQPDGTIIYANKKAKEFFDFAQPIGHSLIAVTQSYDLMELVRETIELKVNCSKELEFHYPDDRLASCSSWLDHARNTLVFVSIQDVTELRRLERIRRDFVANVSHELRTPMAIIRSMAETLLDEEFADTGKLERYLQQIVVEVDRLTAMTNDLLVLSHAENEPVEKQVCDFRALVRGVFDQMLPTALEKGLYFSLQADEPISLPADPEQITQVVLNLLTNAINYTPSGFVRAVLDREGEFARLRVQDSGIGIAKEHHSRVFERFYRADKGRSKAHGGTGLGLSIVKHILEAHGGHIEIESDLNVGTTFTALIPITTP